jgi:hypothetical protein
VAATPQCVVVHPPDDSEDTRRLAAACRDLAHRSGHRFKALRSRSLRVAGKPGRRMNVLAPDEAAELYRMVHRGPTLVVALAAAAISIDPSREPPTRRDTRSLETFVAYKAVYGLARKDADVAGFFEQFDAWRSSVGCEGAGDPRALPLHVFDADGVEGLDLDSSEGAARFQEAFGSPSRRLDGSGRVWEKGPSHGREVLEVAGCALPAGTHWDVSAKRSRCTIANAREVWRLQANGYLNVYPDAGLRGPSSRHRNAARRVWPAGTKNAPSDKGH